MIREDVVLFNDCGCEIEKETITQERSYLDIIISWIINPEDISPEDKIEIEKIWHKD